MELRFNLMELGRRIALQLSNANASSWTNIPDPNRLFKEIQPNMWVGQNKETFYAVKTGRHTTSPELSHHEQSLRGVRVFETKKGVTVFYDDLEHVVRPINWSLANIKYLRQGLNFMVHRKTTMHLQLTMKPNGTVVFRTSSLKGGPRYLSTSTMGSLRAAGLSEDIIADLMTLRSDQEWLKEHISAHESGRVVMAMNLPRSCSSLQSFLNKVNLTDHPVSSRNFRNLPLQKIMNIMELAVRFENPSRLLEHPHEYFNLYKEYSDEAIMLKDYLTMCQQLGLRPRYTSNPKKLKQLHDDVMMQSLKASSLKDATPIRVAEIYKSFAEFLSDPCFELITTGERLKLEGLIQKHCVGTYASSVNSGICAIYSTTCPEDGKRYTAEIRVNGNQLQLNQLRGFQNRSAPESWNLAVKEKLNAFNEGRVQPAKTIREILSPDVVDLIDMHRDPVPAGDFNFNDL
jgi:hypothetical protein